MLYAWRQHVLDKIEKRHIILQRLKWKRYRLLTYGFKKLKANSQLMAEAEVRKGHIYTLLKQHLKIARRSSVLMAFRNWRKYSKDNKSDSAIISRMIAAVRKSSRRLAFFSWKSFSTQIQKEKITRLRKLRHMKNLLISKKYHLLKQMLCKWILYTRLSLRYKIVFQNMLSRKSIGLLKHHFMMWNINIRRKKHTSFFVAIMTKIPS